MLLIIGLGVGITLLFYFYTTRNFTYWKERKVYTKNPIPIFGNIFQILIFKLSIGSFLQNLYNSSKKPVVGFFSFNQPVLLIHDTEIIKQILIKDFQHFSDRYIGGNKCDDKMGANLLFLLRNPKWKRLRKHVVAFYKSGKVNQMIPLLNQINSKLLKHIGQLILLRKRIDVREISMQYSTDTTVSIAYGITSKNIADSQFRTLSKRLFNCNSIMRTIQSNFYFIAPQFVKLLKMKLVDPLTANSMKQILTHTIRERLLSKLNRGDLIDLLIKLKKENNEEPNIWDNDVVLSQAFNSFIGGFDTVGSTISYALFELSLNQNIQNQVRTEIQQIFKLHGEISYKALNEMKYLDMVVSEALRKYPILPLISRYCNKDYHIPNANLIIEKGTPIYISLLGLHHDSKYFPDPEKFSPERFNSENKLSRPSGSYLPFGDGPRHCIGKTFGILNSKVALVHILLSYEVITYDNIPRKFDNRGIFLTPNKNLYTYFKVLPNKE